MLVFLAMISHFCTCLWISLGFPEDPEELTWFSTITNFYFNGSAQEITENSWTIYFAGLFYVIGTLTTVGYGSNTGISTRERLFAMVLLFFGILVFAIFFEKIKEATRLLNHFKILQNKEVKHFRKKKKIEKEIERRDFCLLNKNQKKNQTNRLQISN